MYILKLQPVGKSYLWGGTRLKEEYNKKIDSDVLAETWECSVHPDGSSIVINGEFRGEELSKVIELHPEYLGSKNKQFPVLVKFIDAKEPLSVQVHPNDEYAQMLEKQNGKTEMWYIIDADEGASIIYGFRHKVTKGILEDAVKNGNLEKHLRKLEVHKGDVVFVPAGMIHGIGAGILLAEVEESSNITYRVYDYNRKDKNGKLRELHFDKATDVLNMNIALEKKHENRMVKYYPGCSREILCRCKYFETEKIQVTKGFSFSVLETSFQILTCIDGYGQVETMDRKLKPLRFSKGETMFLPAGLGKCLVVGDATILKIRC